MDKGFIAALLAAALFSLLFRSSNQAALPEGVYRYNNETSQPNRTIADLVQHQTDAIKKLVSNHRPLDYPIVTKYTPSDRKKPELDKLTLEELKIRCQHLAKILNATTPPPPSTTTTTIPKQSLRPLAGFYVTTDASTTTTTTTTTPKAPQNVKYIKLEPVILQKTILSDGRTIYYWHKSLPSAVQVQTTSTPPSTTSTTTTTTSTYNFRNFFPSFYSAGGAESAAQTTTEKTTAASEKPEELLYRQQLRFVVPVPYAPPDDVGLRKPWEFDQFAYYPKPLQPETITLQVPYVPTFHVIKALAVPNDWSDARDVRRKSPDETD